MTIMMENSNMTKLHLHQVAAATIVKRAKAKAPTDKLKSLTPELISSGAAVRAGFHLLVRVCCTVAGGSSGSSRAVWSGVGTTDLVTGAALR